MARPTKQGIDYFPMDCQFDDKIEMLLIEKGANGLAVLVTLWQMIYSNEGYFIADNKDLHLLVKRKIDVDVNEVSDCINVCLSRGIFDEAMHENHGILTSKAIQRRYFDAAKKKKTVSVIKDYIINGVSEGENFVYSVENATNVKEEVKEKEIKHFGESADSPPAKSRFAEFWACYPKKRGKAPCEKKWKAKKLDAIADKLIADVRNRQQHDKRWRDGFIPDPATYLAQERWEDELGEPQPQQPTGQMRGESPTDYVRRMTGLDKEPAYPVYTGIEHGGHHG